VSDRAAGASAIVLAGGDGVRLRPLTRAISGDDRPKQFCPVLGGETLLETTRRRTAMLVPPGRTLFVVTRAHERYYAPALADADPRAVVAQPRNRGTAPAILYALLRLRALGGHGPVALFPSDHHVAPADVFMGRVGTALDAVRRRPDLAVLVGLVPDRPEVEYGWIEPGAAVVGGGPWPLHHVRRFWEKPPRPVAQSLLGRGSLWNTFVLVAQPGPLEALIVEALPELDSAFALVRRTLGTAGEDAAVRAVYAGLAALDFSRLVLQRRPDALAVLPVAGVSWNDLGDPARVRATRVALAGEAVPA
jgi:mannose-1-phosphate guanylyltransferase